MTAHIDIDRFLALEARLAAIESHPWTPALLDRLDECERQVAWLKAGEIDGIEGNPAQRPASPGDWHLMPSPPDGTYDPSVSAMCGIALHDPDGDPVGMSGDDARKIVAAIRAGQIPNIYHGDAIPDYTQDAMREIAALKAKMASAELALRGLPNAKDQPAGASPARAASTCSTASEKHPC